MKAQLRKSLASEKELTTKCKVYSQQVSNLKEKVAMWQRKAEEQARRKSGVNLEDAENMAYFQEYQTLKEAFQKLKEDYAKLSSQNIEQQV